MPTTQKARYHSVAYRLPSLPPEVVHEVIGDLQLTKILELICSHNIPYVDSCVISHIALGKLFCDDSLQNVKGFYTVYLNICKRHHVAHLQLPRIKSLEVDAFSYLKSGKRGPHILSDIQAALRRELNGYVAYIPALEKYSSVPIPHPEFWEYNSHLEMGRLIATILIAEDALNAKKSIQLERMAELIKENPGMLKIGRISTQEPCRNEKHGIDQLSRSSRDILKPQILDRSFVTGFIFGHRRLCLEPYNRCLRVFLKVLEKFPPKIEVELAAQTDTPEPSKRKKIVSSVPHEYPPELRLVLDGMAYVHVREGPVSPQQLLRILYTPFSAEGYRQKVGLNQPRFHVFEQEQPTSKCDRILPIEDKELAWLEAFVKICKYMSAMQEIWSEKDNLTVADYWKARVAV